MSDMDRMSAFVPMRVMCGSSMAMKSRRQFLDLSSEMSTSPRIVSNFRYIPKYGEFESNIPRRFRLSLCSNLENARITRFMFQ